MPLGIALAGLGFEGDPTMSNCLKSLRSDCARAAGYGFVLIAGATMASPSTSVSVQADTQGSAGFLPTLFIITTPGDSSSGSVSVGSLVGGSDGSHSDASAAAFGDFGRLGVAGAGNGVTPPEVLTTGANNAAQSEAPWNDFLIPTSALTITQDLVSLPAMILQPIDLTDLTLIPHFNDQCSSSSGLASSQCSFGGDAAHTAQSVLQLQGDFILLPGLLALACLALFLGAVWLHRQAGRSARSQRSDDANRVPHRRRRRRNNLSAGLSVSYHHRY
jgi:hypothetical protein